MYLKNIEVQGFKSFANKINFEFHNGITGIVGPNGSGKSNVADAVRWVLGEQKIKQLRGSKMEDVIFSGTETRRAQGFAYVAITLDNSDHQLPVGFDEVKVSRRIFRSGESEYKINGAVCRLKDIHELFYDTGIGKEGYSIIGQGQIDKILSGKPEDRRELFDEAAGIVKFKRRKSIALKKLDEEKQNLLRVRDIITELENQIKPLERQSEAAKTYLKLRDELKLLDINVFLLETKDIKERISGLETKYNVVSKDFEDSKKELELTKSDYDKMGQLIDGLNEEIDTKKILLNQKKLLLEKFEGEIKVLMEQINGLSTSDMRTSEREADLEEALSELEIEGEGLAVQKREAEAQILRKIEEKNKEEERQKELSVSIEELEKTIEESKSEIIELLNEKSTIKSRIQRFDTMMEQIENRKSELKEQLSRYSLDKEKQELQQKELLREEELTANRIKELQKLLEEFSHKKTAIEKEILNLTKNHEQTWSRYHVEVSRLEALKNLTERYEGFGSSIRKIMELKDKKQGIIGVVADIIKVEKKYETAIETCLGGNIQNVVTDTEKTAKDIIEYLKKNKFGRATFLPLSNISNKTGFTNEKVLSEKGVIGLACDLVSIDKKYQGAAKYLLGRIVAVDTIDNGLALARKYNYTFRIVTLEGELLNVGGSLTGGAFKNSSNLLGRRREIEELEKSIQQLKEESNELKENIRAGQHHLTNIRKETEETTLLLQEQVLLKNTVEINLKQADLKNQELLHSVEYIHKESNEISGQIHDISSNNGELLKELQKTEERNTILENTIRESGILLEERKKTYASQGKQNEELRIAYSNLLQKESYLNDRAKKIAEDIEKYLGQLQEIQASREQSACTILNKQSQIGQVKETIETACAEVGTLEKEIEECIVTKEMHSGNYKEYLEKREEISVRINELDKEIFRLSAQKEKLEESYENQINYIWNEYEITYNTALTLQNEEITSAAPLKMEIEKTKSEIKKLGDININAIEEYKSVTDRYQFLKTQHDDLVKAEETLSRIVEELDQGMRRQFKEKFGEIQKEFNAVFKEMFGGGNGSVELVEDEDILEAGISITAQPPGKKLQSIMQLSGGEKALTAIALLFAIQNLKPSPFCLLDEIEAALDDSNVIRFSDYLHKLTKYTQFIVITHRKGTMASADRLYGITMQEKGVSALVSVNLLESQLDA